MDLKKFGLPALIALVGIVCITGGVFTARFIGNAIATTETATTPPDIIDPVITVTATEPAVCFSLLGTPRSLASVPAQVP